MIWKKFKDLTVLKYKFNIIAWRRLQGWLKCLKSRDESDAAEQCRTSIYRFNLPAVCQECRKNVDLALLLFARWSAQMNNSFQGRENRRNIKLFNLTTVIFHGTMLLPGFLDKIQTLQLNLNFCWITFQECICNLVTLLFGSPYCCSPAQDCQLR